jgi:enamine deaminase RidA (YjgF/YER057c/UK114 family)
MSEQQPKGTAAQRLEMLENQTQQIVQALQVLDQSLGNITTNLQSLINAVSLLNKRVQGIINVSESGKSISSGAVADDVVMQNVKELEGKIEDLKKKGIAVSADQVQENSMVVGRELDEQDGTIVAPRVQFPVFQLNEDKKEKVLGKKVGDIVSFEEGRNKLEITELYNIVVPKAAQQEESEAKAETETKTE